MRRGHKALRGRELHVGFLSSNVICTMFMFVIMFPEK